MKTNSHLMIVSVVFLLLSGPMFAQTTQSKLLNIPVQPTGTITAVNQSIDFRIPSNTTTMTWPINTNNQNHIAFLFDGGFIPANNGALDTYYQWTYCGQAPRFASQTITDIDGNLKFFIVDNYIYDDAGDFFTYLHPDQDYVDKIKTSYDPQVGQGIYWGIYHNIIEIPKDFDCGESFIISAAQDLGCTAPQIQISEVSIKDDGINHLKSFSCDTLGGRPVDSYVNFAMGANNPEGPGDNMFFIYAGGMLSINNCSDPNIPMKAFSLQTDAYINTISSCSRPDLTVTDFGEDKYLIATSTVSRHHNVQQGTFIEQKYLLFITIPKNFDDINTSTIEEKSIRLSTNAYMSNDFIYGMEFSNNSQYLYFTVENPLTPEIQYVDLTTCFANDDITLVDIPDIHALTMTGDYKNSELEMGRNGKLYAIHENGSITSISGADNPTTATINYNELSITCHKMNKFALHWADDMGFCFSHQLDGSTYTENRYVSYSSANIDWNNPPYDASTQTWSPGAANNPFGSESGEVFFNMDLTIPSRKYITLENMTLHFNIGKKITVNIGSTLALDNSTLTSDDACNAQKMWLGVYLEGNANLNQDPTNQARIRMEEGAVISNAICGAYVESGAICFIVDGTFLNNRKSIHMSPYTHPTVPTYNASLIQSADFIIDQELNDAIAPTSQVYLDDVNGIDIFICNFINSRDNSVSAEDRGNAIYTEKANYNLSGAPNMTNTISGFLYAANSLYPVNANHETMNISNNYHGIYLKAPVSPTIEENNITIVDYPTSSNYNSQDPNTFPYGCFIWGDGLGTNFTFENNIVTAKNIAIGLYLNNTGKNSNIVRDNVFQGNSTNERIYLSCANFGKNSNYENGLYGDAGVQYRCNIFENYVFALAVIDGNIRKYQGDGSGDNQYAGNAFDRSTYMNEGDFYVDANIIPSTLDLGVYTYYANTDTLINGYYYRLDKYTTSKINNPVGSQYIEANCDEESGGGGIIKTKMSVPEGTTIIAQLDNESILLKSELEELVDNGNTMQLLSDVEVVNTISDQEVADKVADADGYLSDEVAITYLRNENANQYAKVGALIANSPLPSNIISEIENAPIDDDLKIIISLNQNGINVREQKEMQIADLKQSRQLVVNSMIRKYWDEDCTDENRLALKNFLNEDNTMLSQKQLFDIYLFEKDYDQSRICLDKINNLAYICDMDYSYEIENCNHVLGLIIDIEEGILSTEDAVEQNLNLLQNMKSQDDVVGSVYAAILLDQAGVEPMHEVIRIPELEMQNRNSITNNSDSQNRSISFEDLVNIYPNPASEFVYVEYILNDISNFKSLNLYDISGSLIKSYPVKQNAGYISIDVTSLTSGTYIVSMEKNGSKFSKHIIVE